MLTNNIMIVQSGFHAQTLQARILQNVLEWYVFFVCVFFIIYS